MLIRKTKFRCFPAAFALTSLGLVTACTGGDGEAAKSQNQSSDIPSLSQPSEEAQSASAPASAPVQAERPLIRPDTSEEEEWRLRQVHQDCLAQQGLKMLKNDDGSWKGSSETGPKFEAAMKTCASKEPETLPAKIAREDPGWKDKYRLWIKCMRSHGIQAEPTWDTPGYFSFTNGAMPTPAQEKWVKKCEAQAYVTG